MIAAAIVLAIAALVGLLANPVAKWFARGDAELDALVAEALDPKPDYEANVIAFDRMGRTR